MGVIVSLPLFSSAGHELGEGEAARPKLLRDAAAGLSERLVAAAGVVEQLGAAGWSARVGLYDLLLSHPAVQTREQAERRLGEAGVSAELFVIFEDVEEDEDGAD